MKQLNKKLLPLFMSILTIFSNSGISNIFANEQTNYQTNTFEQYQSQIFYDYYLNYSHYPALYNPFTSNDIILSEHEEIIFAPYGVFPMEYTPQIPRTLAASSLHSIENLPTIEVHTSNELRRALGATGISINSLPTSEQNGKTIVRIMNDITLSLTAELVSPPANSHRHIILIADEKVNISISGVFNHFTINNRTTLTIDSPNINIIGRYPSLGVGIRINNGGELFLNDGTISNINRPWPNNAVSIYRGGLFTMNGGVITNNRSNYGGGVAVTGSSSTFIMNNGAIIENTATSHGGGVDIDNTATFEMQGGYIINNTANLSGGGVRVDSRSTFTMQGGYIADNIANGASDTGGGGVAVFDTGTTFNMYQGTISGNIVTRDSGGGVRINNGALFNMQGGIIKNNHVTNDGRFPYGGGVALFHANSTFNMNGGSIINNSAHRGGGVAAWEAIFNMGTGNTTNGRAAQNTISENIPIISNNRAHGAALAQQTPM